MGYLIEKTNVGLTEQNFIPTFSNLSANVTSMVAAEDAYYYLLPAKTSSGDQLLQYYFSADITTTIIGNFNFTVNLPNNYNSNGMIGNLFFTCNASNSNFNVLHLNASTNSNINEINCAVHSTNLITNNVLYFSLILFITP